MKAIEGKGNAATCEDGGGQGTTDCINLGNLDPLFTSLSATTFSSLPCWTYTKDGSTQCHISLGGVTDAWNLNDFTCDGTIGSCDAKNLTKYYSDSTGSTKYEGSETV